MIFRILSEKHFMLLKIFLLFLLFLFLRLGYFEAGLLYKVPPDILEVVKNQIPLKRFGSIDDLYKITDFIINDNYATGQTFELTGGL